MLDAFETDFATATAAACVAGEVGCELSADANELEKFGGNCPDAAAASNEPDAACE